MQFSRLCKFSLYRVATLAVFTAMLLPGLKVFVHGESPAAVATDDIAVAQLKKIQDRVNNVVSKVMPACVSVSDGMGAGSGVIISADGLILTAAHVMTDSPIYEIILPSGETVKAKPLGRNRNIDAGMLQIINKPEVSWPHVSLEKQKKLKAGQWVVSLGHSGGFEIGRTPPVRTGRILEFKTDQVITDAVLIGGDSGGPLFNLDGKLIGIHSSIGDTVAENRHVTVPAFLASWDRMLAGKIWGKLPDLEDPTPTKRRGVIGVRVDLAAPNCRIRVVNAGSPAQEAGLEVGDVVLQFNDTQINNGRHLIEVIKRFHAGDVCNVQVLRASQIMEFEVQLK